MLLRQVGHLVAEQGMHVAGARDRDEWIVGAVRIRADLVSDSEFVEQVQVGTESVDELGRLRVSVYNP